jgi:hypothetical protein
VWNLVSSTWKNGKHWGIFENIVLRTMFGPKIKHITGDSIKLYMYISGHISIATAITSRRITPQGYTMLEIHQNCILSFSRTIVRESITWNSQVKKESQQKIYINKSVGDLVNWMQLYYSRVKWRYLVKTVIDLVR